ncbi:hypothetical protein GCM10011428_40090 [Streptomyces violaceus]
MITPPEGYWRLCRIDDGGRLLGRQGPAGDGDAVHRDDRDRERGGVVVVKCVVRQEQGGFRDQHRQRIPPPPHDRDLSGEQ